MKISGFYESGTQESMKGGNLTTDYANNLKCISFESVCICIHAFPHLFPPLFPLTADYADPAVAGRIKKKMIDRRSSAYLCSSAKSVV